MESWARRRRSLAGLLLALNVVLAGCSSANDARDGVSNSDRSSEPSDATETETTDPSPSADAELSTRRFVTPSGNIGCITRGSAIRCDIMSGLRPEPVVDCPVDWTGLTLDAGRLAGPTCAGDGGGWEGASVFPYGRTWSRGDLTCKSESTGLTCSDTSGNGFELARAGWKLFGKKAAARAAFADLRALVRSRALITGSVSEVLAPALRFAGDCGELQEAVVQVEFQDMSHAVYTACYAGSWQITDGPLYVD
jgi:uncharacterized protein DUF6636